MSGGGPLPDEVGDYLVARGTNVISIYGGTEFNILTPLVSSQREKGDWAWMEFVNDGSGVETYLRPSGEGLVELLVKASYIGRKVSQGENRRLTRDLGIQETETFRPAILNTELPDGGRAYATSDLFVKHPTKKLYKMWVFRCVGGCEDAL